MKHWRLIVLMIVGTLLVGVVLYCHDRYVNTPPLGSGPAGPVVDRGAFAETWTDRKVLLLGLGDSITTGFGAEPRHSYFRCLVENPYDELDDMKGICLSAVLPNLDALNRAVSGSTSIDHLRVIERSLEERDPNVFGLIVITTGGNDLIHDYGRSVPCEGAMYGATMAEARPWISNFQVRLHRMIDLLQANFPGGCKIFLADVYDPTDGVGDITNAGLGLPDWPDGLEIHAAYNDVIHRCAAERASVVLVSIYRGFLGHGIHCDEPEHKHYRPDDPTYWYFTNLEDPNRRGYDAIRRLYLSEIAKLADELAVEHPPEPMPEAATP